MLVKYISILTLGLQDLETSSRIGVANGARTLSELSLTAAQRDMVFGSVDSTLTQVTPR